MRKAWQELYEDFGTWRWAVLIGLPVLIPIAFIVAGCAEGCKHIRLRWPIIKQGRKVFWMAVRGERVYAIGFGNWVELRSCKKPPRPIRTEFEKETEVTHTDYRVMPNGQLRHYITKVPRKISINNTMHTGGKVLGTVHMNQYYAVVTTNYLPRGHAAALTKIQTTKLLAIIGRPNV